MYTLNTYSNLFDSYVNTSVEVKSLSSAAVLAKRYAKELRSNPYVKEAMVVITNSQTGKSWSF